MWWHALFLHLKIFYKKYFRFLKKRVRQSEDIGDVFKQIYLKNCWGSANTISGPGSELTATQTLIPQLNKLLDEYKINSILDIPCGDFNWMRHVDLKGHIYIGVDIVSELIESNIQKYKNGEIDFKVLNLTSDKLPCADLILCRDGLVHFSYKEIFKALRQIKQSGTKYLLTTTFNRFPTNYDITTGEWRPLNLQLKPFNFPDPICSIIEYVPSNLPVQYTKLLSMWEINSIGIPDEEIR